MGGRVEAPWTRPDSPRLSDLLDVGRAHTTVDLEADVEARLVDHLARLAGGEQDGSLRFVEESVLVELVVVVAVVMAVVEWY